jgi:hypothetical protein
LLKNAKKQLICVSAKSRHLLYKISHLLYKISQNTGSCSKCALPVFILQTPANACFFMSNYCFCMLPLLLPVGAGYCSSRLVASNGFVITNPTNTCRTKNNAPLFTALDFAHSGHRLTGDATASARLWFGTVRTLV